MSVNKKDLGKKWTSIENKKKEINKNENIYTEYEKYEYKESILDKPYFEFILSVCLGWRLMIVERDFSDFGFGKRKLLGCISGLCRFLWLCCCFVLSANHPWLALLLGLPQILGFLFAFVLAGKEKDLLTFIVVIILLIIGVVIYGGGMTGSPHIIRLRF